MAARYLACLLWSVLAQHSAATSCTADHAACVYTCGGTVFDLGSLKNGTGPAWKDESVTGGYYEGDSPESSGNNWQYYWAVCAPITTVTCGADPTISNPAVIQDYGSETPPTLDGQCAGLGAFSSERCQANGTKGMVCSYTGGDDDRSVDIVFSCEGAPAPPTCVATGNSAYTITMASPAACGKVAPGPGPGPGGGSHGLSGGSLFLILFAVAIVLYAGGGFAYNVKVKEMEPSIAALPQLEYWKQLPGLVKDGMIFSFEEGQKAYLKLRGRSVASDGLHRGLTEEPAPDEEQQQT